MRNDTQPVCTQRLLGPDRQREMNRTLLAALLAWNWHSTPPFDSPMPIYVFFPLTLCHAFSSQGKSSVEILQFIVFEARPMQCRSPGVIRLFLESLPSGLSPRYWLLRQGPSPPAPHPPPWSSRKCSSPNELFLPVFLDFLPASMGTSSSSCASVAFHSDAAVLLRWQGGWKGFFHLS